MAPRIFDALDEKRRVGRRPASFPAKARSGLGGTELVIILHQPMMLPRWIERGSSRRAAKIYLAGSGTVAAIRRQSNARLYHNL
jgi:hypothetical protein